jgi:hypothetical protein
MLLVKKMGFIPMTAGRVSFYFNSGDKYELPGD